MESDHKIDSSLGTTATYVREGQLVVSILSSVLFILLLARYSTNLALGLSIIFVAALYLFARSQIRSREIAEADLAKIIASPPVSNDTAFRIAQSEALQEKLREAEALHQSLIQTLPFSIFRKDVDGKFIFVNNRFCDHINQPQENILGKTDADLFGEELAAKYTRDDAVVRQSESNLDVIETHQSSEGAVQYVHVVKSPLYDANGAVSGVQGVFWDVTERRRAEEHLAAEKERLSVTLRSIGDGVISTDTDGKITLMNQVAEELTGWTQSEARGQHIAQIFKCLDAKSREPVKSPVEAVLDTGHRSEPGHRCLLVARSKKEFLIEDRAASMRDRQRQIIGAVLVFQDITGRLQLEVEAAKASRIESIGFLAGGIAHDFNNILTAILGNLSLAKFTGKLTPDVIARLDLVEKASMRARELTQQLLTFAKGGAPVKQTASLVELIRESTAFALRGSKLRANFEIDKDLAPAEVDSGQIHQVIHNLVLNAVQAMPNGGTIYVTAKNHKLISRVEVPLPPGNYIRISVRDEGPGIPVDLMPKIFDPYFTTKHGGTGLGLATAFSIIKRHEGILTAESTFGQGAVFHLYLPASLNAIPVEPVNDPTNFKGSGRILVMDDEEPVRNLVSSMLQHFGYSTEACKDGAEAIIRYGQAKRSGEPFTAVIMDLTIPGGMGGREALQLLRLQDPNIRAIVSSGYCNDPVMAKHREHGFAGVVEKPYTIEELGRVLHDVVETNNP